jgi:hypothetical protein
MVILMMQIAFGEYDANGVWKIKTSPSVTYGTNGFFILKDGNSVQTNLVIVITLQLVVVH